MKVFRRILLGIVIFFFGFLLCFNIYQFVSTQILGKSLATLNGYAVLEVVSGSMEPTIHVGDLIVIDTKDQEIKENDIVTFTDVDGSFVTHRVVSISDDEMITRGDNNNSNDPVSSLDTVVGKYLFKLSGLGILLSSLKNPFVMFMIFVVGLLICYYLSLDHHGNFIMTDEEREYQEFLEYQKLQHLNDEPKVTIELHKAETSSKRKKKDGEEPSKDLKKTTISSKAKKEVSSTKKTSVNDGKKEAKVSSRSTKPKSKDNIKNTKTSEDVKTSSRSRSNSASKTEEKKTTKKNTTTTKKAKTEKVDQAKKQKATTSSKSNKKAEEKKTQVVRKTTTTKSKNEMKASTKKNTKKSVGKE